MIIKPALGALFLVSGVSCTQLNQNPLIDSYIGTWKVIQKSYVSRDEGEIKRLGDGYFVDIDHSSIIKTIPHHQPEHYSVNWHKLNATFEEDGEVFEWIIIPKNSTEIHLSTDLGGYNLIRCDISESHRDSLITENCSGNPLALHPPQ